MPETILNWSDGRVVARYHPGRSSKAPIAVFLHHHPLFGGNMNSKVIYHLYYAFAKRGFTVLRFNFRGVGRSEGTFENGLGELSLSASVLDWMQGLFPESRSSWVVGFSFGSWIGMQLLMRRPEVERFISISPPANIYDFSFLAPCPASGFVVHGDADRICPPEKVVEFVKTIKMQKKTRIELATVSGADHVFTKNAEDLIETVGTYVDRQLAKAPVPVDSA